METVIHNGFILQAPDCDGDVTREHTGCSCPLCVPGKQYFDHERFVPYREHAAPFEPNWAKLADRATD